MKSNGKSLFYQRISDQTKIELIKQKIAGRRAQNISKFPRIGTRNVICEAPCDCHFEKLYHALLNSPCFIRSHKAAQYKYDDINGDVHLISGMEVVTELYRDIVSKDSQLFLLREQIRDNLKSLQLKYNTTRRVSPGGVVRVSIGWLLHELVLQIESQLHLMKSNLELHAIFTQFLFPPHLQGIPGQMSDHIRFFARGAGKQEAPFYSGYLNKNMDWYDSLKTLRDAVTHFGGLMLVMEETDGRHMWIYFYPRRAHVSENRVSFEDIEFIVNGYYKYIEFYRSNFLNELNPKKLGA